MVVLPCKTNPSTYFAVIVSISHQVADGHTYYKIHSMLCHNVAEITPLTVERRHQTNQQLIQLMGRPEATFVKSRGFILNLLKGKLQPMVSSTKMKGRYVVVDAQEMVHLKQSAAATRAVPFCSTNDVLTSWFLSHAAPDGIMFLNLRGRLEGLTDHHAGNYVNAIFYKHQDAATPALIRQTLLAESNYRRTVTTTQSLPSVWALMSNKFGLVTNWASFAQPNDGTPGCREDLHLPIFDLSEIACTWMALCICRAGPNKVALYIAGEEEELKKIPDPSFFSSDSLWS